MNQSLLDTLKHARETFDKLARLGNEPYYGNSEGNVIAKKAIQPMSNAIAELEKAKPVAKIVRNTAGQIHMTTSAGNAFDMSKFIGASFFLHPSNDEELRDNSLNTLAKMFHGGEEMEGEDGAVMVVDLSLWNEGCEAIEALIGEEDEYETVDAARAAEGEK